MQAYFYVPSTRYACTEFPEEVWEDGGEGKCGTLPNSLYGTRDAALNWSAAYGRGLAKLGFTEGASPPCTFWHAERRMWMAVPGVTS